MFTVSRIFLLVLGVLPALPRDLLFDLLRLAEVFWEEARWCRGSFLDFLSSRDRLCFPPRSFRFFFFFSSCSDSADDEVGEEAEGERVDQPDWDGLLVGRLLLLHAS